MSKVIGLLIAVLITISITFAVAAQEDCQVRTGMENGVMVINAVGCKEVAYKYEGTLVHSEPGISLPTPYSTVTLTPTTLIGSVSGSETPYENSASVKITYKEKGYVNVHVHHDFRPGYVITDLLGTALLDKYYPVVCTWKDDWYKIGLNGKDGWIHIKGQFVYAELVNPNNISIPYCE